MFKHGYSTKPNINGQWNWNWKKSNYSHQRVSGGLAEIVNSLSCSFASQNIACFSVSQYLQQINDENHLEKY